MSIDMYLNKSKNQASNIRKLSQAMNQSYDSLNNAVLQFVTKEDLQGKAYRSAKQFFSAVVIPLSYSMKTLSDMTEEACTTFVERYTQEVDNQSLKESELEEDINELKQRIALLEEINGGLKKYLSEKRDTISRNNRMIASLEQQKHELEEKLRKLQEFNQKSPEIFKDVEAFQDVVKQGLNQLQTSWNPVTKEFNIPSGKDLEWAKVSNEKYLKVAMKKIEEKAKTGKLNKQDGKIIQEYAEKHQDEDLPQSLINYFIQNKDNIKQSLEIDISSKLIEQIGVQSKNIGVFINTAGGYKGPKGPNSFVQVKRTWGDAIIKDSKEFAKNGKILGGVITGLGFFISVRSDLNEGKTCGEALSHNALTMSAGWVTSTIISGTIIALAANPVGWAALAGIAVGTLAAYGADWAYQNNKLGIKDKVDWLGHKMDPVLGQLGQTKDQTIKILDNTATNVSNGVKNTAETVKNTVGEAVNNIGDNMNPMKWKW
ncbi:T7SS effector LXG polymorphic toxin [Staphylococcus lugdunensis]|uniref:T7SS effector LXG polymorphic toxin n=1 Tax=Staphylococcus lugdunensis TaxID=28035 RepID=UPI000A16D3BC|nr:T7SS effector LXG polymorphic toxin [Staphylococcus lugdunensis]ARJ28909.1 transposase [Staphylococcus lugdunensis]